MIRFLFLLLFFAATPATAQPTLLFESHPGMRLVELGELIPTLEGRHDYNGDGVRDLTIRRGPDASVSLLDSLLVISFATMEVLAHRPFTDISAAMGSQNLRFLGYFDVNGDAVKEAAFFDRDAQVLGLLGMLEGGKKHASQEPFVIPARTVVFLDLTADEQAELIISNPQTETVQVYGLGETSTSTEAIEVALAPLLESFPNPFREQATLEYEVPKAGPVTLTVYDLLGRRVRTLLDADLPSGLHRAVWDGTDASGQRVAAGTYFYQLRINDAVTSKQVIRLQ